MGYIVLPYESYFQFQLYFNLRTFDQNHNGAHQEDLISD